MARVVVVGAGVIGVSAAYHLQSDGHKVTVVDRDVGPALGTSFANAGLITPSMSDPWNSPGIALALARSLLSDHAPMLLRLASLPNYLGWGVQFLRNSTAARFKSSFHSNLELALASARTYEGLCDTVAIEHDRLRRGCLRIFRNPASVPAGTEFAGLCVEAGLTVSTLSGDEVVAQEPALAPIRKDILGGMHFPNDQSGDAHKFARGLLAEFQARGGTFLPRCEVKALEIRNRTVTGVDTSSGRLDADILVLAAGSDTLRLTGPIGLKVPLRPVKGYSLTFDTGADQRTDAPRIPVSDHDLHVAITPLGRRLRVAGTAELAGYCHSLSPRRIQNLWRVLGEVYPSYRRSTCLSYGRAWCGLRPVTADGVPIISKTRVEGLYLNTGHGHLGWTLGPGSGRLIADIVADRSSQVDPSRYALARFSRSQG